MMQLLARNTRKMKSLIVESSLNISAFSVLPCFETFRVSVIGRSDEIEDTNI